jgi:hypothetical protein
MATVRIPNRWAERPEDADITSGQRTIGDGKQFDQYFDDCERQDKTVVEDGGVEETMDVVKRVIHRYYKDAERIAPTLRRATLEDTCRSIWNFLYGNIQYKLDDRGLEQLRRPSRSWVDRQHGIDCDDFSIFASSILMCLGIPHTLRITKYSLPSWQHVYVTVPRPGREDYYTIDAVLSRPLYEKPFSQKKDYPVSMDGITINVLSGTDDFYAASDEAVQPPVTDSLSSVLFGLSDAVLNGEASEEEIHAALGAYLENTRRVAAQAPQLLRAAGRDPHVFLQQADYALKHWNTPNRGAALAVLAGQEDRVNALNGFADDEALGGTDDEALYGADDDMAERLDGLGAISKKKASAKTAAKSAPAKPAAKKQGLFKKVAQAVTRPAQGLKKVATKAVKTVVRYNPLAIASRNGFLLAVKLNIGKMASKLKWAYATPQQAAAKGISPQRQAAAKRAVAKVEKLFVSKLQGKSDALRNAILRSKGGSLSGLTGLGQLGEPVTVGAALLASLPVIVQVVAIMKGEPGLVAPGEWIDPEADIRAGGGEEHEAIAFDDAAEGWTGENYGAQPSYATQSYAPAQYAAPEEEAGYSNQYRAMPYYAPETAVTIPTDEAGYFLEGLGSTSSAFGRLFGFFRDNPLLAAGVAVGGIYVVGRAFNASPVGRTPRNPSTLGGARTTSIKKAASSAAKKKPARKAPATIVLR